MFGVSLSILGNHCAKGIPTQTTTMLKDNGLYTISPQTVRKGQGYFSMCWAMEKPSQATWYTQTMSATKPSVIKSLDILNLISNEGSTILLLAKIKSRCNVVFKVNESTMIQCILVSPCNKAQDFLCLLKGLIPVLTIYMNFFPLCTIKAASSTQLIYITPCTITRAFVNKRDVIKSSSWANFASRTILQ